MPILDENMAKYPGGSIYSMEWLAIRNRKREECQDFCEGSPAYPDCCAEQGQPHPVTGSKVVLTVAHFDHDPENNDPSNHFLWCQRCHNTHDAGHRKETRQRHQLKLDL